MKKLLVVGIIVLLIGVGSQSVFALEDKKPTKSFCIDSENEDSANAPDEIYENTDCFIMGRTSATYRETKRQTQDFKGNIYFGYYCEDTWEWTPSNGYIITINKSTKWKYEGKFYGRIGHSFTRFDTFWGFEYKHYCGVEGFKGFALGGSGILGGLNENCFFIGFVKRVRISPNHP